jgi:hypothetical protein
MLVIDKATKHKEHSTKKQKLTENFLRTLKEEESKSLIKIEEHTNKRINYFEKIARETAQKQQAFMPVSPKKEIRANMHASQSQFFGAGLVPVEK